MISLENASTVHIFGCPVSTSTQGQPVTGSAWKLIVAVARFAQNGVPLRARSD